MALQQRELALVYRNDGDDDDDDGDDDDGHEGHEDGHDDDGDGHQQQEKDEWLEQSDSSTENRIGHNYDDDDFTGNGDEVKKEAN